MLTDSILELAATDRPVLHLGVARPVHVTALRAAEVPLHSQLRAGLVRAAWSLRAPSYRALKRLVDISASVLGLCVLSPLLLVVALAVKAGDGGPVFFTQTRVGRGGRLFRMFKFRSMRVNADSLLATFRSASDDAIRFKLRHDPRVTRVGQVIRRLSIDELPQLLNVLRGDMTLVGPRPPLPEEVTSYDAHAWMRLDATPGLTCTWQIGGRSDISFAQQVAMDLAYIARRNTWIDLTLILRTVPAVVAGRGAY